MNRITVLSALIALLLLTTLFEVPAQALGLGIYVNGAAGKSWYKGGIYSEFDGPSSIGGRKRLKGAMAGYGAGIMMDTDPDSDGFLNYRLSAGYERAHVLLSSTINLNAIRWNNTWGFRLFSDDFLKVWLGPSVGIDYLWGKDAHSTFELVGYYLLMGPPFNGFFPVTYTRRYKLVSVHTGLALGVNFNLGRSVTLTLEAGCRLYTTLSLREVDALTPSGTIRGVDGYILFGLLGRVN